MDHLAELFTNTSLNNSREKVETIPSDEEAYENYSTLSNNIFQLETSFKIVDVFNLRDLNNYYKRKLKFGNGININSMNVDNDDIRNIYYLLERVTDDSSNYIEDDEYKKLTLQLYLKIRNYVQ